MLSYGIELEVIASLHRSIAQDEVKAVKHIAETIRTLGYRAAYFLPRSPRDRPDYSVWNVCLDVTIVEETSSMDDTMKSEEKNNFGVELVSPIFYDDESCDQQIAKLLGSSGIPAQIPLAINRSTGLHIHVGCFDGEKTEFSLNDVRALAYSVVFFESKFPSFMSQIYRLLIKFIDTIDKLHHRSRSVEFPNDDLMSNRENTKLQGLTYGEIWQLFFEASSVHQIISAICFDGDQQDYTGYGNAKFYKVNFSSIGKCGTIEFRQHIATIDPDKILWWKDFILLFVWKSINAPPSFWRSLTPENQNLGFLFSDFLGRPEWHERV